MSSFRRGWILVALVAALGGAGTAVWLNTNKNADNVFSPSEGNLSGEVTTSVDIYLLNKQTDRLIAVPVKIREKSTAQVLRLALASLIKNVPDDPNLVSAIPADTEIIDLQIQGRDIRINLSRAFQAGGGSASIQGRLFQVLYTLTSIDNDAKVYLSIEGKPVEYLGGEGLEVKQPMTRQDYPQTL